MTEHARSRYAATWDELETAVRVRVDDQVELQDVSTTEAPVPTEDLDRQKAFGMAGGYPLS